MLRLLAGRLPQMAVTLLLLSLAAWFAIGLMPGDPISVAIAQDPRLTAADAERLRALYGLDRPLLERWLAWGTGVLRGEFGYSRLYARPAAEILWPALRSSLVLLGAALGLSALFGVAAGMLAARRPRLAPLVDAVALASQALPAFWLGILLIILFAVTLGWLPAGGTPDGATPEGAGVAEALRFLVLPVATLAIGSLASYARYTAAGMAEVLRQPYVTAARARGAGEGRIAWRHALPNAAVPLLSLLALDAGALVSGALITETVFARPGMGKLLADSVMGNDFNLALLALLLVAGVTMLATLAADLAQMALDPRIAARR